MSLSRKQKVVKLFTPVALFFIKGYWRVFRPETHGAKMIIENGKGEFVYIRPDYGERTLTFPGGKIERGETPEHAAIRETKEEVGIDVANVRKVGVIISTDEGKRDHIHIFHGKSNTDVLAIEEFEVAEAGWFTEQAVPEFGAVSQRIWRVFTGEEGGERDV